MTSKLVTATFVSTADRRHAIEQENAAELRAYKEAEDLSVIELGQRFGCSRHSMQRYLDEQRPVPGYIVSAIRGGKVAA